MSYFKTMLLVFSLSGMLHAQSFYDLHTIQTIRIVFKESNWDALLDAEKAGNEGYIMAQNVTINGTQFDSVGVKYKGNSTYRSTQVKNPFHIELDTYKEQDFEGYTDIKLSNVANDPSFLREVISYQILGKYMDAPLSNYANVYVNGVLIGLYSNSESVSKKFVKSHFGSKKNTFIKCNPPAGAGPSSSNLPKLAYLGTDSTKYFSAYELQSDHGWNELINLCDTLTNKIQAIENILDVDRALWMLAFDNVLVNLDSYIGQFGQNYYLYRDDNGRFVPVVWDLNESFGRFSQTGYTSLNTTADKQKLTHLLHQTDTGYPLVKMLLGIPLYKRMYLAHFKTILQENFSNNSYYQTGLSLQTSIASAVQADNNKFFTYANFTSNLTTDVSGGMPGPGGSSTPGITNLMNGRSTYLLAQTDFTNAAPEITTILLSDTAPVINQTLTITATISNATTVYLGYRTSTNAPFVRIQMYDDATNGDAKANDGQFTTYLLINASSTQYYIYAENTKAGMFSPQRAEHEFHTLTATTADVTVGHLVINEFMASNSTTMADHDNEFNDWIELYNNGPSSLDVSGYYLSDDANNLTQWAFPSSATVLAGDYMMVWADNDVNQTGLHANFKLSATAGSIFLSNASGTLLDKVTYGQQNTDVSYGRAPNGIGDFQAMPATFKNKNILSASTVNKQVTKKLSVYPNPANMHFYVNAFEGKLIVYNLLGEKVFFDAVSKDARIDTSQWPNGIYLVKVGESFVKLVVAH